jgi:ketosteroid isomerase-like protein
MNQREADEVAIRNLVANADAFQNDVERFASLLTEDVVIVNIAGIRVSGRDPSRRP